MPAFFAVLRIELDAVLGFDIHRVGKSLANLLILVASWLNLVDSVKDGGWLKINQVRLRIVPLRKEHSFRLVFLGHQVSPDVAPILARLIRKKPLWSLQIPFVA